VNAVEVTNQLLRGLFELIDLSRYIFVHPITFLTGFLGLLLPTNNLIAKYFITKILLR
jgi:hypothetical protein